jgi:hypothetical protein
MNQMDGELQKRVLSLQRMIKVYVLLVRVDQGKRGILKIHPFGTH